MKTHALVLLFVFAGCSKSPPSFKSGDIVRLKLTGERLHIVGLTNKPFYYGETYEAKDSQGKTRDMIHPNEIQLETTQQ